MNPWLLLPETAVGLLVVFGILHISFSCIEYWHAARRREDLFANRERGD